MKDLVLKVDMQVDVRFQSCKALVEGLESGAAIRGGGIAVRQLPEFSALVTSLSSLGSSVRKKS